MPSRHYDIAISPTPALRNKLHDDCRWIREADRGRRQPWYEQPPVLPLLFSHVDVDVDVDVSQVLPLLTPQLQLGGSDGCGAEWSSPSSPSGGFTTHLQVDLAMIF